MTTHIRNSNANSNFDYRRRTQDESQEQEELRFVLPHQPTAHASTAPHTGNHQPFRKPSSTKGGGGKSRGGAIEIGKKNSKNTRLGASELGSADDDGDLGTDLDIPITGSRLGSEGHSSRRDGDREAGSRDASPKTGTRRQAAGPRIGSTYNSTFKRGWPKVHVRPKTLAPGRGKPAPSLPAAAAFATQGISRRLGAGRSYKSRQKTAYWRPQRSPRILARPGNELSKIQQNILRRKNGADIPALSRSTISQAIGRWA
jgi:hypothetical protein